MYCYGSIYIGIADIYVVIAIVSAGVADFSITILLLEGPTVDVVVAVGIATFDICIAAVFAISTRVRKCIFLAYCAG